MVFVKLPQAKIAPLKTWLTQREILISTGEVTRRVTHLDVDRRALKIVVDTWLEFLEVQG